MRYFVLVEPLTALESVAICDLIGDVNMVKHYGCAQRISVLLAGDVFKTFSTFFESGQKPQKHTQKGA